ncbi:MAG TPA: APC family permease [Candidatus Acidoferrales bacterium]|nr:APC family permease [Candidatus Acidoferrales bacterium]
MASASGSTDSAFRLAKVAGVLAVCASAVSQEYGSGINFVMVNSLSQYPAVKWLVPLAMFAAGIVLIPKVALFARLSTIAPRAGSSYVWLTRSLNLPVGFIAAFLWFVGVGAAGGFLAFASAPFIGAFLTSVGVDGSWCTTVIGHLVIGLLAIWILFALHSSGVHNYATFVSVMFVLVLIAAAITVAYGFGTSQDYFLQKVAAFVPGIPATPTDTSPPSLGAFISTITLFMFAYGGLTAATSLGGEAREPREKTMPRGIVYGFATALVLYTLIAFALFHAVPYWAVGPLILAKKQALATTPGLISLIAPKAASAFLNFLVAVIVVKTIAPGMLDCSRYLFAWANDGLLPAAFAETNRNKAPQLALMTIALLDTLFLFEATFIGWSIGVVVRSISLVLVFGMVGVGIYNMKYGSAKNSELARVVKDHPDVLVWAPLAIIIAVILIASVIVVPKAPWYFQPSFQGLISILIAIWIYMTAVKRDPNVAAKAAAHLTTE